MDRDRAILGAALELFAERGFAAASVDAIGERAGLPGPHIYRHFSGKAELLATLIDEAMDRLLAQTAVSAEDPRDELGLLVDAHARFAVQDRDLLIVFMRESRSLSDADRRRIRRRQRAYVARWVALLRRAYPGRSETELEAAAHGAIGHIQSVIGWPRVLVAEAGIERLIAAGALRGLDALEDATLR